VVGGPEDARAEPMAVAKAYGLAICSTWDNCHWTAKSSRSSLLSYSALMPYNPEQQEYRLPALYPPVSSVMCYTGSTFCPPTRVSEIDRWRITSVQPDEADSVGNQQTDSLSEALSTSYPNSGRRRERERETRRALRRGRAGAACVDVSHTAEQSPTLPAGADASRAWRRG
jgi:hypothetical protein